jgi:hypothetical protein
VPGSMCDCVGHCACDGACSCNSHQSGCICNPIHYWYPT